MKKHSQNNPYLRHKCVICDERIHRDDWNEKPDSPAHRLCWNSRPVEVWSAPLSVHDMILVWNGMRKGVLPRNAEQFKLALIDTFENDRRTEQDVGYEEWSSLGRRRAYAARLITAMYNYDRGYPPTGPLAGPRAGR